MNAQPKPASSPAELDSFWMPFTANRQFKANPRLLARADGMLVVKARYRDEVDRLFANLAHLGIRRVGMVYQDDGLGKDVLAGAAEAAERRGVILVGSAAYPRNTTDTSAAVASMVAMQPQAHGFVE